MSHPTGRHAAVSPRVGALRTWWLALPSAFWVGFAGVLAMFVGLVSLQIFAVPPFVPADESGNVEYAFRVAHGHIPLAGPYITPEFAGQRHVPQTTSNHPPAYHLPAGLVLRAAVALHAPIKGVFAVRILTALSGVVAIGLIVALVLVWRGRRQVKTALAAAGLTAALTQLITVAGVVENDTACMVFSLGALVALLWIIRAGPSRSRLLLVTACTALAMLTRAQMVALVAIVAAGLVAAALIRRDDDRPPRRRLLTGLLHAGIVVATCAATSGWFYVLNVHRYGDPLGGSVAYRLQRLTKEHTGLQFEPTATSLPAFLTNPRSWARLFAQFYGGGRLEIYSEPRRVVVVSIVCAVVLAGSGLAFGVRAWRAGRRPSAQSALCTLVVATMLLAMVAETGQNAVDGAGANGRYLLSGIAFCVAGAAIAVQALPTLLAAGGQLVLLAGEIFGTLTVTDSLVRRQSRLAGLDWFTAYRTSLADVGVPAAGPVLVALLVLIAGGLVVQIVVLARGVRWPIPDTPESVEPSHHLLTSPPF